MEKTDIKKVIDSGESCLGIELGSTRIKAVLIGPDFSVYASGEHTWENRLENGIWTYSLDDVWSGLRDAYASLAKEVKEKYDTDIKVLKSAGFSAMMHGYLPFDKDDNLLTPFRTWRNTITAEAAQKLTNLFEFNIPQRWSIAHLYQAVLNDEDHIDKISFITTLAGYVHWKLTGDKVLGVGEASGMFPIDSNICDYDKTMLDKFSSIDKISQMPWNIRDILPKVLIAGDSSSHLTEQGAILLDPTGTLRAGAVVCPPEGDAGTGMVATNSVTPRTGNISAGTSIFSMVVLDKALENVYSKIDMVTTPSGAPVAMVHCNNCTSEIDAWVKIFAEYNKMMGFDISKAKLYDLLYEKALEGDKDCGGIYTYNYLSGEPVTDLDEGRPLMVRLPDAKFNLANFMRTTVFSAMATLKYGNDILHDKENIKIDCLTGHGGLFKTPLVGQKLMAAAMRAPIAVMKTAAEGGAWGIAVLALYAANCQCLDLASFLQEKVFKDAEKTVIDPDIDDIEGFNKYMQNYISGLACEKAATERIR